MAKIKDTEQLPIPLNFGPAGQDKFQKPVLLELFFQL
jgi:hypothetical protein